VVPHGTTSVHTGDCSLAGTNQRSLLPVNRRRRTMSSSSQTMELYISSALQGKNFIVTKGENIVY